MRSAVYAIPFTHFPAGFQDGEKPFSVYAGTSEADAAGIPAVVVGQMEAIALNLSEAELSRARAPS